MVTGSWKYLVAVFLFMSCIKSPPKEDKTNAIIKEKSNDQFSIETKIITNPSGDFGYEIWVNGRKTIFQPTIPGVAGTNGFKTKAQAEKGASLVKDKIRKNIMPPSVSVKELDSLGIKY